jgi:antitoxin (DNA-binding transcriptional repressor) of toxin-antitoxin stability system
MPKTISATEASRTFADLLTRVRHHGEEFIVERGGELVCRISPVGPATKSTAADLARLIAHFPPPDPDVPRVTRTYVRKQDEIAMEADPWER